MKILFLTSLILFFGCSKVASDDPPTGEGTEAFDEESILVDDSIKFVAVGTNGTIITSPDGESWTLRESSTAETFYNVRKLNNKIFTVGSNGTLLTSDDGINWQSINTGTTSYLQDIYYHNGLYVAVGGNEGTGGSIIITSSDLVTWTKIDTNVARELSGIIHFKDRFQVVAAGGSNITGNSIGNSTDGSNWGFSGTNFSHNKPLTALVKDNNFVYIVGSDGVLIKSDDYFIWDSVLTGTTSNFTDIIYDNNTYLIVGRANHVILKSTDASNWQDVSIPSGENLHGATYGGDLFLVVGDNGSIYKSNNAVSRTSSTSPNSNILYSVESI